MWGWFDARICGLISGFCVDFMLHMLVCSALGIRSRREYRGESWMGSTNRVNTHSLVWVLNTPDALVTGGPFNLRRTFSNVSTG